MVAAAGHCKHDSPNPIFARIMLSENLAGLLRESPVAARRQLLAPLLRWPAGLVVVLGRFARHDGLSVK